MGKHSDGCDKGSGHDSTSPHCSESDYAGEVDYGENGNPNNRGCFQYSALINTPQGKIKIGDLSVGQMVWSFQNGGMVKRAITKKLVYGNAKIMAVEFGEGESQIRCTASHSFLTDKGYLELSKIVAGDSIVYMDANGNEGLRRVTGITDTKTREPVFNLYTQGEHNFIVDGYVAHNFTRFRALRIVFHRLFLDGQIETSDQSALQD